MSDLNNLQFGCDNRMIVPSEKFDSNFYDLAFLLDETDDEIVNVETKKTKKFPPIGDEREKGDIKRSSVMVDSRRITISKSEYERMNEKQTEHVIISSTKTKVNNSFQFSAILFVSDIKYEYCEHFFSYPLNLTLSLKKRKITTKTSMTMTDASICGQSKLTLRHQLVLSPFS